MSQPGKKVSDYFAAKAAGASGAGEVFYFFDHERWFVLIRGLLGDLSNHQVKEEEDGSISVTPSILITGSNEKGQPSKVHGYLTRGNWSDC